MRVLRRLRNSTVALATPVSGIASPISSANSRPSSSMNAGHPYRSDQQIHRSLEKGRMIAFDPVTQEQERPAAYEQRTSPDPFCEKEQNESGKDHGDADTVQQFVPAGRVFVIVLRHVVRQTQSAPPCGDSYRGNVTLY